MKLPPKILCLYLAIQSANAAETLSFSVQVEDETLAEEAILLTHCLSEHSGHPWEYTEEANGPRWLKLKEEGRKLRGSYRHEGKDFPVEMTAGEADEICNKLEPASGMKKFPLSTPQERLSPETAGTLEPEGPSKKHLLWLGIGIAAIGGFLLWKSHQPSYRSIEMR